MEWGSYQIFFTLNPLAKEVFKESPKESLKTLRTLFLEKSTRNSQDTTFKYECEHEIVNSNGPYRDRVCHWRIGCALSLVDKSWQGPHDYLVDFFGSLGDLFYYATRFILDRFCRWTYERVYLWETSDLCKILVSYILL